MIEPTQNSIFPFLFLVIFFLLMWMQKKLLASFKGHKRKILISVTIRKSQKLIEHWEVLIFYFLLRFHGTFAAKIYYSERLLKPCNFFHASDIKLWKNDFLWIFMMKEDFFGKLILWKIIEKWKGFRKKFLHFREISLW